MRYLLNSPVLAEFGEYKYREPREGEVAEFATATSAVGHPGTAEVMSAVLGFQVEAQRLYVRLEPGDSALVFQVTERLPEGKVLSAKELREVKYRLGVMERLA